MPKGTPKQTGRGPKNQTGRRIKTITATPKGKKARTSGRGPRTTKGY